MRWLRRLPQKGKGRRRAPLHHQVERCPHARAQTRDSPRGGSSLCFKERCCLLVACSCLLAPCGRCSDEFSAGRAPAHEQSACSSSRRRARPSTPVGWTSSRRSQSRWVMRRPAKGATIRTSRSGWSYLRSSSAHFSRCEEGKACREWSVGAILIPADQHEHGWTHTLCALSALWERGKRPSVVPLSLYSTAKDGNSTAMQECQLVRRKARKPQGGIFELGNACTANARSRFGIELKRFRLNSLCCASVAVG